MKNKPGSAQKTKAGKARKKGRKQEITSNFVDCEYCSASMAEHAYADHVKSRHPEKPVNSPSVVGAKIASRGLTDAFRKFLKKLPGYRQQYEVSVREVQGGAPGSGRRGR